LAAAGMALAGLFKPRHPPVAVGLFRRLPR
jgi:hypothetical protein